MSALQKTIQRTSSPFPGIPASRAKILAPALIRSLVFFVALMVAGAAAAWAAGGGYLPAFQTARSVLDSKENATTILSFVHFGADYKGHTFLEARGVADQYGNTMPGRFSLFYRYYWADDGVTDIAFLCTEDGTIYRA